MEKNIVQPNWEEMYNRQREEMKKELASLDYKKSEQVKKPETELEFYKNIIKSILHIPK